MTCFFRQLPALTVAAAVMTSFLIPAAAEAAGGGVALGATRVVYPAGSREVSLPVTNSDKKNRFLVQSWVEDGSGKKSPDFIVTPPLFVSKPGRETSLRIMYAGEALPTDRESIYWLNSKAIPSIERNDIKDKNVLQIAILSRIKLFVRPVGLAMSPADAPGKLQFRRQGSTLTIENPTPYYITLVKLTAGTQKLPNTMVAPKSYASVLLPSGASGQLTYRTVNDYGAQTPQATVPMN